MIDEVTQPGPENYRDYNSLTANAGGETSMFISNTVTAKAHGSNNYKPEEATQQTSRKIKMKTLEDTGKQCEQHLNWKGEKWKEERLS